MVWSIKNWNTLGSDSCQVIVEAHIILTVVYDQYDPITVPGWLQTHQSGEGHVIPISPSLPISHVYCDFDHYREHGHLTYCFRDPYLLALETNPDLSGQFLQANALQGQLPCPNYDMGECMAWQKASCKLTGKLVSLENWKNCNILWHILWTIWTHMLSRPQLAWKWKQISIDNWVDRYFFIQPVCGPAPSGKAETIDI